MFQMQQSHNEQGSWKEIQLPSLQFKDILQAKDADSQA